MQRFYTHNPIFFYEIKFECPPIVHFAWTGAFVFYIEMSADSRRTLIYAQNIRRTDL